MKEYIKNLIFEKPFATKTKWDEPIKTRRNNGLTVLTGASKSYPNIIGADEWNDIVYYIEDLEERIESLERRVGRDE